MDRIGLDIPDIEHFYRVIDASICVRKRYQCFLWTQGELQSFLPHEILICASGDLTRYNARLECFSGAPFGERMIELLNDPVSGLMPRLVASWRAGGCSPIFLPDATNVHREYGLLAREIRDLELINCAAHGVIDGHSGAGAFFAFFRIPNGVCRKYLHCIDLLVPHLYMTYQRVVMAESQIAATLPDDPLVLSVREAEILHWMRAGKTNQEIGHILNISSFTVKNHVQKILRKLNVANRTQAVAKPSLRKAPPESITR